MGKEAVSIGANTFQFFTRNPRGSKAKAIDEADVAAFLDRIRELKLDRYPGGNVKVADLLGIQDLQHDDILISKAAVINDIVLPLEGMSLVLQCLSQYKHLQ